MRLTLWERSLLETLRAGKRLPKKDKHQQSLRYRLKRLGYIATERLQWRITPAGIAALDDDRPIGAVPWRELTAAEQTMMLRGFILQWCKDNGRDYDAICLARRSRARQQISVAVKRRFPEIGPMVVALNLGGVDQSTVCYAWRNAGFVPAPRPPAKKKRKKKTKQEDRDQRLFRQERRHTIYTEISQRLGVDTAI